MEHIAFLKKSRGLTKKILSGEKKVESRWYNTKYAPRGRIKAGETVYFKDSGSPISLKATVSKVEQYENLDEETRQKILKKYSHDDLGTQEIIPEILEYVKGKKYCIMIHLSDPLEIKPFEVSKKGFGLMASWICVEKVERIKI